MSTYATLRCAPLQVEELHEYRGFSNAANPHVSSLHAKAQLSNGDTSLAAQAGSLVSASSRAAVEQCGSLPQT